MKGGNKMKMKIKELKGILEEHEKYLLNEEDGSRADLSDEDLSYVDLTGKNLSGANLKFADLYGADLKDTNLSGADLTGADLTGANLNGADLSDADLSYANLRGSNLSGANLRNADLYDADLRVANLRDADLSGADLSDALLNNADLSGAEGLLSQIDYLSEHFEKTYAGIFVYKTFEGGYTKPNKWPITKGLIITENVNFTRTQMDGCGVSVNTLEISRQECQFSQLDIWKCLIKYEWLPGVCVPYSTDGNIRAEKIQLLEKI